MKKASIICTLVSVLTLFGGPAYGQQKYVVRSQMGQGALQKACASLGCKVANSLGDPDGQLFLVHGPAVTPSNFKIALQGQFGVLHVEEDQLVKLSGSNTTVSPASLNDRTPVNYYGATLWNAYVNQWGAVTVRVSDTHSKFNASGNGTVAIIDTGLDPTNAMFKNVVVQGYDFTRNRAGVPNEQADLDSSTAAVLDSSTAAVLDSNGPAVVLDSSTAAVLDSSTAAVLDTPRFQSFGHGTMVAGIVHLVAPQASLMPLKTFQADGSAKLSDIISAVYYATSHNANVIHMSFEFPTFSNELHTALWLASLRGVVAVAAAGNDSSNTSVYPASYNDVVMGVASTNTKDQLSSFSNYGSEDVWVGAPGENIVSAYPFGSYAVASGTSFSAPMVSGAVSLLLSIKPANESQASTAIANANKGQMGKLVNGRLDVYQAVQAWMQTGSWSW